MTQSSGSLGVEVSAESMMIGSRVIPMFSLDKWLVRVIAMPGLTQQPENMKGYQKDCEK